MSRRVRHRTRRATLPVVVALLVLACLAGVARATEARTTVVAHVRAFQEYRVSASGLQSTFEYDIVPLETGAPMPVDDSGQSLNAFSLTRDDELDLAFPVEVALDEAAQTYVYHYTLKPTRDTLEDGLYYVNILSPNLEAGLNVYYLELHVQPSSVDAALAQVTPTVHVEGWDGPKVTDPGWRVGYQKNGEASDPGEPDPSKPGQTGQPGESSQAVQTLERAALATTADGQTWWLAAFYAACGVLAIAYALWRRSVAGGAHA